MVMTLNIRGIDTFSPMTACLSCLRGLQRGIWTDFVAGFAGWCWVSRDSPLQACNSVFIWIFHVIGGLSWSRDVRLGIRVRHCRSLGPCGVLLLFLYVLCPVYPVPTVQCPVSTTLLCAYVYFLSHFTPFHFFFHSGGK